MAYFICERQDRCCPHEFYDSLDQAIADSEDGVPCDHLIEVAPVVHGRWDDSGRYTFPGGGTAVRCTECGCALTESEYHLNNWNYCPVCGAKMDGERKDGGNADENRDPEN